MTRAPDIAVVTLDAGGTLIEPIERVGETYARLARREGFTVDAAGLEAGFRRAFGAAPPLAAPPATPAARLAFERTWWRAIVDASLDHALGDAHATRDAQFRSARDRFFEATFAHYARGAAWRVFPEVPRVLGALRRLGCTLVVVSNFDARLDAVLEELGIRDPFAAVVVSSEAGAAKPAPAIFAHALARVGGPSPARCLHVGDALAEDVAGARTAGLRAAWLDRAGDADGRATAALPDLPADVVRIATLEEVVPLVHSPA